MNKFEFRDVFTLLCETYGKEPTKVLMSAYYMVLEDLTVDQIKSAIKSILANRKYSSLPLPAEILEFINGSQDDKALLALHELESAMKKVGAYNSVCFSDSIIMETASRMGGWARLCRTTEDEWKFLKKEFINIYKALSKTNFEAPKYLIGLHQNENECNGFIEDVEKTPLYLVGFKNIKNDYICVKQFPELAQALNLQIEAPKNKVAQLVANIGQRI